MKTTTLQLLPTTSEGTPSGNYDGSSEDFAGVRQKAANYYSSTGGLQTVGFFVTNFQGYIHIEASLETDPTNDVDWFKVHEFGDGSTSLTVNTSTNITGNFSWMRARVLNFDNGTINKVTLSY
jgi:hypothetical protein